MIKVSKKGIDLIKEFEGCRLSAYRCPAGVLTIGYGHTTGVHSGDVITKEQAEEYLMQDLETYENMVLKYDDIYHFNQHEFDALVSFAYNIGNITGLTRKGTRSKQEIADSILLYVRAAGTVLPGLVRRRRAEHDLFTWTYGSKTDDQIAAEVLAGKWGNGRTRRKNLTEAGYDYDRIQKLVNKLKKISK